MFCREFVCFWQTDQLCDILFTDVKFLDLSQNLLNSWEALAAITEQMEELGTLQLGYWASVSKFTLLSIYSSFLLSIPSIFTTTEPSLCLTFCLSFYLYVLMLINKYLPLPLSTYYISSICILLFTCPSFYLSSTSVCYLLHLWLPLQVQQAGIAL